MKAGYDRVSTRRNPAYAPKTARAGGRNPQGRPVGVIAVRSKRSKPGDFNPLVIFFTVNHYRKDYNQVVEQVNKKAQLPKYEQSLFDSCFKNWGA